MYTLFFVFTLLANFGAGQVSDLICAPIRQVTEEDFTSIQGLPNDDLVSLAEDIFGGQMDGLTVQEAALSFPSAFNETIVGLVYSGLVNESDYFFLTGPIFEALFNYPDINEILLEVAKTPDLFEETIVNVLVNWDQNCSVDVSMVTFAFGTDMIRRIFLPDNKDYIVDIVVGTVVQITQSAGTQSNVIAWLEPVVAGLDAAKASGSLASFLVLLDQDALVGILSAALTSAGWQTDVDALSALMAGFLGDLQGYLEVDDSEMLEIWGEMFSQMLEQLE
eukprot:TRINITY_DN3647_c0_g1_i1.p1 TRINITY_DN3647_c0_g1~~TRINITY_DN3647_c0_g1_i1.p1  ORF type:complete len:278 (+),score=37.55 TRINITY_DN3647_c0_g1_i1:81-914(+)